MANIYSGKKEPFMSIIPRDGMYSSYMIGGIPLRVIMKDGVKFDPDIKISATKLSGQKSLYRNDCGPNFTFQVTTLLNIHDDIVATKDVDYKSMFNQYSYQNRIDWFDLIDDLWDNPNASFGKEYYNKLNLMTVLDAIIRSGSPVYVYTRAIDINCLHLYQITEQKERKQTHDIVNMTDANGVEYESGYVQWDLTFTRITPYTPSVFKNTNSVVKKAVAKSQTKNVQKKVEKTVAKTAAALTTAVTKTANKDKLKKCDPKKIYYSKNRRVTDCTKYMQEILHTKGFLKGNKSTVVDGWYGDQTLEAVKKFKKKWAKKYNLQVNGTIGDKTIKALTTE